MINQEELSYSYPKIEVIRSQVASSIIAYIAAGPGELHKFVLYHFICFISRPPISKMRSLHVHEVS